jgi:hypothetical protein
MPKTTPGLKAAGVPTVLWNTKPRTIAMMSGLSAAIPERLRSPNAAVAIVVVRRSPGRRLRPDSQRALDRSSAVEVKVCIVVPRAYPARPDIEKLSGACRC